MASILDLAAVISERTGMDERIAWLQGKGLIARNKTCPSCNQPMHFQSRSDVTDKNRFINHSKSLPGFHSSCMKVEVLQLQLPQVSWLA